MRLAAPFQPSPRRDNGYDISDYYGVDPRFGTLGDFVEFMHEASSAASACIIDLVVNHTSDQHPWFQAARRDPDSPYRDWYVWSKRRPTNWNKGVVFPGVQKSTWTYDREAGAYYFHRFYDFQPDLNMDNPRVREEVRRIMGFWLQLGVAGLPHGRRAVRHREADRASKRQAADHFEYLRASSASSCSGASGDAILLGEANVLPQETQTYFGDEGDGMHMMFNFWVNQHLFSRSPRATRGRSRRALERDARLPPTAQWAHFLRNHDELDLGRLTERAAASGLRRSSGRSRAMQLYDRGIRRRLAPMLGDDRGGSSSPTASLFSLPGTPVLRYGDEIGMGENLRLNERDAIRTPMQWSDEPQRRLLDR